MGHGERTTSRRVMADVTDGKTDKKAEKKKLAWKSLPEAWALLKPRKGILALGLLLILINRGVGFALPGAMKLVFDNVIGKHQVQLLIPIILAVITATIIQGATSFTLMFTSSGASSPGFAPGRSRMRSRPLITKILSASKKPWTCG